MQDPVWGPKWEEIGRVGRLAWQWNFINANLAQAADRSVLKTFRFEDIFDDAGHELNNLLKYTCAFPEKTYNFTDPRPLLQRKLNTSRPSENRAFEWTDQERAIVNDICQPIMERFGYPPL